MLTKILAILGGLVLLLASCWLWSYLAGYDAGVKDTEDRWHDAVGHPVDDGSDII